MGDVQPEVQEQPSMDWMDLSGTSFGGLIFGEVIRER